MIELELKIEIKRQRDIRETDRPIRLDQIRPDQIRSE